ncbi:MAG: ribbon-helix-helix protein, CopG family [Bacteroidota bacterium]|nr:ribbon-helix-helix protein, CopG family [Bacteroidota bacterium]MDE2956247.1 ribbon-helix-helix protein, CopG family [Bacteroidota bacterium]
MAKSSSISVTIGSEQLATIDENARQSALSRSEYMRRAALGHQLRTRVEEETHRALIRLGLQLKALRSQCNCADLDAVVSQIRQVLDELAPT